MTTLNQTANPLESAAWLITYASSFDNRVKTDPLKESVWLDQLGDFDPHLIKKGIAAYYGDPDKARWEINPGVLLSWCRNALPPRPRCPDHPSYYAGPACGGCRSERLELGTERAIGRSSVPQLESKPVPMPESLRARLHGTLKRP